MSDPKNGPTSGPADDTTDHTEPRPDDEDRRAQDRAYHNAYNRARRAARLADGRCVTCGKPRDHAGPGATAQWCAPCAARYRDATRGKKTPRIAPDSPENVPPTPGGPVCPGCGSGALWRRGVKDGRQRYSCKVCGRQSFGVLPEPVPEWPCPYCKAQCVKGGRRAGGSSTGARRAGAGTRSCGPRTRPRRAGRSRASRPFI